MTINVSDIVQAIMDSKRGIKRPSGSITMHQALIDAGIKEEDHHAFFQVIVGRGEFWNRKRVIQHAGPELVITAAFCDGLLIGFEAASKESK